MTVLIYGAGAVGLGIASCLDRSGMTVHVVARPTTADALEREGLLRTGIFGEHRTPPGRLHVHRELASVPAGGVDFVLVATKSFDTEVAARDLARHGTARGEARYVLSQNGWGNVETFSAYLEPERVFAAAVITGFTRPAPAEVRVTVHADDIRMGSFVAGRERELEPLAAAISGGGIPCSTAPELARILWAKMLYNCALNPLGATVEATYGELGARAESRRIMNAVVREVFAVMTAAGYRTHWDTAEAYLKVFYETQVPRTAAHASSMLQDIRAGKRTEIEALSGAVVSLGERHGVDTPACRILADIVRWKERLGREGARA